MRALILVAIAMCGCASIPPPQQMQSQQLCDTFAHRDDSGLIGSLSKTQRAAGFTEATNRRGLLSSDFKGWVIAHDVRIGMRQDEVLCSWGTPDKINSTQTRVGDFDQWVYARGYVYFRGAHVVSIQN